MRKVWKFGTILTICLLCCLSMTVHAEGETETGVENALSVTGTTEPLMMAPEEQGEVHFGWYQNQDGWYFYDDAGRKYTGWLWYNEAWWYLDGDNREHPGLMAADGAREIGGSTYFFDASGRMLTGWIWMPEGWYYYDPSGARAYGWRWVDNAWYYLDGDNGEYPGLMAADTEREIGGSWYRFWGGGAMITGWFLAPEGWYYYDPSGAKAEGWCYVDGSWYYLDPENQKLMVDNQWKVIGGARYFLHAGGHMASDWVDINGEWYWFGQDGAMKTGWQYIGGFWYYLYDESDPHGGIWGAMAKGTVIDGYRIGVSGKWSQATQYAANVLDQIGWNIQAAFNWSAGLTYYRMTSDPSPGSEWFANYGFENGYGNCYVMAATFCYMADVLGYEVHQMAGYVPQRGGGMTPHSWCEVVIDQVTYVFDPNFTNETGRNGFQISYGTSGTWIYSDYYRMN